MYGIPAEKQAHRAAHAIIDLLLRRKGIEPQQSAKMQVAFDHLEELSRSEVGV